MKHSPQPSPRGGGPKARSDKQSVPATEEWVGLLSEVVEYHYAEWRNLCSAIKREGRKQKTNANGKVSNPLVSQRKMSEDSLFKFGGELNKALAGRGDKPSEAKVLSLKERLKALEGGK